MSPVTRPDAVSFTSTGCIVAISEIVPSMMRPPCCGASLAAADADDSGLPLADGVPPLQAVATSIVAARAAMRARPVRGWLMIPSPLLSMFPGVGIARVYGPSVVAVTLRYRPWRGAVQRGAKSHISTCDPG